MLTNRPRSDPAAGIFSPSCIECFLECQMSFYWKYVKGLEAKAKSSAMLFGSIMHEAHRRWYECGSKAHALEAFDETRLPDAKYSPEHGKAWFKEFLASPASQYQEVLDVESAFSLLVVSEVTLIGIRDMIVDMGYGAEAVEFKTAGQLGRTMMGLQRSFQIATYDFAGWLENPKSRGVWAVVLSTAAKPERRVKRELMRFTPRERGAFTEEVDLIAYRIQKCIRSGDYIPNRKACNRFGECPFSVLCWEKLPEHRWGIFFDKRGEEDGDST